jgi:DNA-binding NarL/FixJ family response regulator
MRCISKPGSQHPTTQREKSVLAKENTAMIVPRVFIADDQEEMLQTVARMLDGEFQVVGTAENGMRVLELAPSLSPDILVLDISMPVVNGIEVACHLKESGSAAKVIFLTVHADPDFVEAAMSTGALGYVLKPCLATDLVPAIWTVLGGNTFVSPAMYLE